MLSPAPPTEGRYLLYSNSDDGEVADVQPLRNNAFQSNIYSTSLRYSENIAQRIGKGLGAFVDSQVQEKAVEIMVYKAIRLDI